MGKGAQESRQVSLATGVAHRAIHRHAHLGKPWRTLGAGGAGRGVAQADSGVLSVVPQRVPNEPRDTGPRGSVRPALATRAAAADATPRVRADAERGDSDPQRIRGARPAALAGIAFLPRGVDLQ